MHRLSRRQMIAGLAGLAYVRPSAGAQEPPPNRVEIDLTAAKSWVRIGNTGTYLDTYNGLLPGPAIEAKPGDGIMIRFRNEFPEPTNLHFHGLHVSPEGRADNVLMRIPRGEEFRYEFDLPTDHPAGLFWYHPHVHGLAAGQLSRGLAGLFVIRGELDAIPEIGDAVEQFLVLQDFEISRSGLLVEPNAMERIAGREGSVITINGSINPTIPIDRGGWLRLRILNASSSRYYRLAIAEHTFHLIATEGGGLPAPAETAELLLAPGERVDAMVQGNRSEGRFRLLNLPYNRTGGTVGLAQPQMLGFLEYAGVAAREWSLPGRLLSVNLLQTSQARRSFVLGGGMGMGGGGMGFTINGRTFNERRVDTETKVGATEDWQFVNPTTMDHPMHVHTNPFQVVAADGQTLAAWKDVVNVPARSSVTVRTQFRDFTGQSMYHCHILDHEDLGMMGTLQISGE